MPLERGGQLAAQGRDNALPKLIKFKFCANSYLKWFVHKCAHGFQNNNLHTLEPRKVKGK